MPSKIFGPAVVASIPEPLSLVLDGRKIEDGGIGTYLSNLIEGIVALQRDEDIPIRCTVIVSPRFSPPESWKGHIQAIQDKIGKYSFQEFFFFGKEYSSSHYHLFHEPHYTLPSKLQIPSVVTIHDLIHLTAPERFFYPFIARRWIQRSLRKATKVIAVSEATKRDIECYFPWAAEKVSVIPNSFSLEEDDSDHDGYSLSLPKKFFLAIFSNNKPHKGRDALLRAFSSLKSFGQQEMELLLVGPGSEGCVGIPGVRSLGKVSRKELRILYRMASWIVISSTHEGFCLPVLEAHAVGTPIITRPVSAVLELLEEGDIVAADFTEMALAEALQKALRTPMEKKSYNISKFTPKEVARRTIEVYQAALGVDQGFQKMRKGADMEMQRQGSTS